MNWLFVKQNKSSISLSYSSSLLVPLPVSTPPCRFNSSLPSPFLHCICPLSLTSSIHHGSNYLPGLASAPPPFISEGWSVKGGKLNSLCFVGERQITVAYTHTHTHVQQCVWWWVTPVSLMVVSAGAVLEGFMVCLLSSPECTAQPVCPPEQTLFI